MNARQLIDHLKLEPLPVEGGYFRQTYRAAETLAASALNSRYSVNKPVGTAIYYLLTAEPDSFSALHRLPTDEIYHFYLGDPVELLLLYPAGSSEHVLLGPDVLAGQQVQFVVPRDVWQGSRLRAGGPEASGWALLGVTMAPGYTPDDYVGGEREELIRRYPDEAELITALTRAG